MIIYYLNILIPSIHQNLKQYGGKLTKTWETFII
jgi:hypothetical protein